MWTKALPEKVGTGFSTGKRAHYAGALLALLLLAGCRKPEAKDPFPLPDRPVSPIVSPRYSNEDERDKYKEAETVMKLGDVAPGMTVADIGWGHQIRSYVLQPYQLVKDLRTGVTSTSPSDVLDGDLDPFMAAALSQRVTGEKVDVEDVD